MTYRMEAHPSSRAVTLQAIAQTQVKTGERAAATRTLQQALSAATTIPDDAKKASVMRDIAEAQANAEDMKGAVQTAIAIRDSSERTSALKKAAETQVKTGDRATALQTLQQALLAATTIPENLARASALETIAELQTQAGDVQGTLQWSVNLHSPLRKGVCVAWHI